MLPELDTSLPVFNLPAGEKRPWFEAQLLALTEYHYQHCEPYRHFIQAMTGGVPDSWEKLPPMAAELFKYYEFKSIPDEAVIKTMHSSGTSGQQPSQIFLDRETALLQSRILGKILQSLVGAERLPMLIADSPQQTQRADRFAARRAGVQGIALFGRDHCYMLDEQFQLNEQALLDFARRYQEREVLLFGFTYITWLEVMQSMIKKGLCLPFKKLYLLHSGGWKKMQQQAVSVETFNLTAKQLFGENTAVHNFYGMVEQTGSIYLQCEEGFFHAPHYADIRIRNPRDFTVAEPGEQGLIETMSLLPRSYPGHCLLTQDLGRVVGEDDCACGRKGRYFSVFGRQHQAENRGCSDSYEAA